MGGPRAYWASGRSPWRLGLGRLRPNRPIRIQTLCVKMGMRMDTHAHAHIPL